MTTPTPQSVSNRPRMNEDVVPPIYRVPRPKWKDACDNIPSGEWEKVSRWDFLGNVKKMMEYLIENQTPVMFSGVVKNMEDVRYNLLALEEVAIESL